MKASLTTIVLKHKAVFILALVFLLVSIGVRMLMQPEYAKAVAWGQCMTEEWVGPTLYTYDCSASDADAASSCTTAGGSFNSVSIGAI